MLEHTEDDKRPGSSFVAVGAAIMLVGLIGTVLLLVEMGDSQFGVGGVSEYTTVDKWMAGFAGLTVTALGAITAGVGAIIARIADR